MAMLQSYSPITEREREGLNDHPSPRGGCTCFRRFCFGSTDSYLLPERGGSHEQPPWLVAQLHKLKHFTERVAGPKWKNLVRRIGKLCNPKRQEAQAQFQYSPESYALNFAGGDPEEEAVLLHSFSTRFAAPMNDQKRGGIL